MTHIRGGTVRTCVTVKVFDQEATRGQGLVNVLFHARE